MSNPHSQLTPQQQLVQALNVKYHTHLSVEQVQFGAPVLVDTVDNSSDNPSVKNSRMKITNAQGEPYEFVTLLHFNRLALSALLSVLTAPFVGAVTHTFDLLPALSDRFGFPVTEGDIVGVAIDVSSGYPLTVQLVAADESLLLRGHGDVVLAGP